MRPDPLTVPEDLTVEDFLSTPHYRYRHAAFPVTAADRAPVGLVTFDRAPSAPRNAGNTVTVRDVMVPLSQITVARPDDPLADLLPRLEPGAEHRVLVADDGRLAGILAPSDVSRT